jgi:FkbM family methyltransferase
MTMLIPDDMVEACGHVFAGEYDVESYTHPNPVILDIGANVGAFSVWATYRWPGCVVHAYEPIKETYEYLVVNTKPHSNIITHNKAIGAKDEKERQMYYGGKNRGQTSFYYGDEQRDYGEKVTVLSAKSLPEAHFVKVDTEGAEVEILENLVFEPEIIVVEFHFLQDKEKITQMLEHSFFPLNTLFAHFNRGMLKLVNKKLLN